jgi:hypothetical protein
MDVWINRALFKALFIHTRIVITEWLYWYVYLVLAEFHENLHHLA